MFLLYVCQRVVMRLVGVLKVTAWQGWWLKELPLSLSLLQLWLLLTCFRSRTGVCFSGHLYNPIFVWMSFCKGNAWRCLALCNLYPQHQMRILSWPKFALLEGWSCRDAAPTPPVMPSYAQWQFPFPPRMAVLPGYVTVGKSIHPTINRLRHLPETVELTQLTYGLGVPSCNRQWGTPFKQDAITGYQT